MLVKIRQMFIKLDMKTTNLTQKCSEDLKISIKLIIKD